jgi:hypothetical protein
VAVLAGFFRNMHYRGIHIGAGQHGGARHGVKRFFKNPVLIPINTPAATSLFRRAIYI